MIPLATIASQLAGTPTQIVCLASQSMPDGDSGYVTFHGSNPEHTIVLDLAICQRLAHPTVAIDPFDYVVLEHEAMHIALASMDECLVERTALANIWQAVRALRLPARFAVFLLANVAAADAKLPAAYHPDQTGAC